LKKRGVRREEEKLNLRGGDKPVRGNGPFRIRKGKKDSSY